MEKNLLRAITKDGSARIIVLNSTEMVNRAFEIHTTAPTATAALGRVMTAASMMGSLMGEKDDALTLRFKGDGEAGSIIASADYMGNVRGWIANPAADPEKYPNGKLNVAAAVGKGTMYVLRDTAGLPEPYVGALEIQSGEIAEDIAAYYAQSEQVPTICTLGVRVGRDYRAISAGGVLLQLLPFADPEIIEILESNLKEIPPISELIEKCSLEEIAGYYLKGIDFDVFDVLPCGYECKCSHDKTDAALIATGKDELTAMIEEGGAELKCQFCDKVYNYGKDELLALLERCENSNEQS